MSPTIAFLRSATEVLPRQLQGEAQFFPKSPLPIESIYSSTEYCRISVGNAFGSRLSNSNATTILSSTNIRKTSSNCSGVSVRTWKTLVIWYSPHAAATPARQFLRPFHGILPGKMATRFPNSSVMTVKVEVGLRVLASIPTLRPFNVTAIDAPAAFTVSSAASPVGSGARSVAVRSRSQAAASNVFDSVPAAVLSVRRVLGSRRSAYWRNGTTPCGSLRLRRSPITPATTDPHAGLGGRGRLARVQGARGAFGPEQRVVQHRRSAIACARGRDRIGRHASDVHLLLHGDVAGDAIFRCGQTRVEDPAEPPALVVVGRVAEVLLAQRRQLAGRRLGAGDRVGAGSAVVTCRTSR